ncbi:hypothetical protein [Maricaulis sp.]|uniref:hypothetical protein n=1 Tax=Maricaulis sp. TaxID=1486257 RepID=UPI0025C0835C|nr:hypothetical protein [Maricaulis sp.]
MPGITTRPTRRAARAAWYKAVGASVEEVELDLQIEEDAERIRRARQAGGPVPEPRWEESWLLVEGRREGEAITPGWHDSPTPSPPHTASGSD